MIERQNCPICREASFQEILQKADSSGSVYNFSRCINCNHVFVKNPRQDTSSGFDPCVDISKYHFRHLQICNLINKTTDSLDAVRVAEVGAGYGHLGKLLQFNSRVEYVGFELSDKRADFCAVNGLDVRKESFPETRSEYDVVVLDNVLEHVLNPSELILTISNSLKEGGSVVIIVPNRHDIRRFLPQWRQRHYWQPHCHISMFSIKDINRMCEGAKLELRPFDFSTLGHRSSLWLKIKTTLDQFGIYIGGLYVYAIKK
jgi:SAM-dependent methyltransferase